MDEGTGAAICEVLTAREDVVALYVFGSTARGTRRERSDVDVGVLATSHRAAAVDRRVARQDRRMIAFVSILR